MSNSQGEVKEFVETVNVEPAGDDEELINESEEETPAVSSTEEKTDEEPTEEPESDDEEPKKDELRGRLPAGEEGTPKGVPGESPVEYARRQEIQRLKAELRSVRTQRFIEDNKPNGTESVLSDDEQGILGKYDPEELRNLDEVIDVLAKKKGFVRQQEFQQSTYQKEAQETIDSFIESHPELDPENDKDNALWNHFSEEFLIYRQPKTIKELKRVLNKTYVDVFGVQPESNLGKVRAQQQKIRSASHGGASTPTVRSKTEAPQLDSSLRGQMKGFDDEFLDELGL